MQLEKAKLKFLEIFYGDLSTGPQAPGRTGQDKAGVLSGVDGMSPMSDNIKILGQPLSTLDKH